MTLNKNGVRHGFRFARVNLDRGMGFILGHTDSPLAEGFFGGNR